MPRGNPDNLTANTVVTPEQMRERNRKAGIASGKARAEKKTMREMLEYLMAQTIKDDTDGKEKTRMEVMMASAIKKAMSGDIKAAEFVRDTSGQKPEQRISIEDIKTIPFEINADD